MSASNTTQKLAEEKIKPFRLVKYFTFTSMALIFLGTLLLSMINTYGARTLLLQKREAYALALVENLNHQIFLQFAIPVALKYGKIQLRQPEQSERMDKVIRSTLHSFQVDLVTIYDTNNTVSYSFDPDLVGQKDLGGSGYQQALDGRSNFKLFQRGSWWKILIGFPKESKLIALAPLRAEKPLSILSGPILGIVEIVQDISEDFETIFFFQSRVIITCAAVMGIVFIALVFVVKRGEGIIERRAQERLRLKEDLNRALHLSSIGEMMAGISHEIRNPLGIIKSSAELLKKKMALLDPSNPIPDVIVEEARRLDNIITDFLNYARPRTPHFVPCDIRDIIDKNITFLLTDSRLDNFTLRKEAPENLPEVSADPDMLYQAFLNILINAVQAMPDGGEIRIALNSASDRVTIFFDDQGHGVSEDIAEKIWDPFVTTKETGTGLGLSIVKKIIESHCGKIRIENLPDGGARVAIELPIKQESSDHGHHSDR